MGTHPLFVLVIGIYRMFEKPFGVGGICIVAGYFKAMWERMERYDDIDFRKSLRAWQFERLKLGKRLENIPAPEEGLYN